MYESYNTSIHINIVTAQVLVERRKKNGVISRKNISPQSLSEGFLTSRMDDERHDTGLLPEGCVTVVMEKKYTYHFIRYPELYADFRYFDTGYRHFPIPRLVFGFKYMPDTHNVAGCSACVVKDERLKENTVLYHYPFSNVSRDGRICLGNNALPVYKDTSRLHTLASYYLREKARSLPSLKLHNSWLPLLGSCRYRRR